MTRVFSLEGVPNLRDYGGYSTACGRGLRAGRFYRAGHQAMATDADLEALAGLGIALVVDLRRPDERERQPNRQWSGYAARVITSDLSDVDRGWEASLKGADPTPEFFDNLAMDWYRRAPFGPRMTALYTSYFEAMAATEGAVLIHCAAGKDRTGLLAALTQHLAGVSRDDIMADYLLTNDSPSQAIMGPRIHRIIEGLTGKPPSEAALRIAMGVRAAHLEAALGAIEARHGSIDAYLAEALGVDGARRTAFEQKHLGG